jgi:6-phosphogluconolactonase (cycloisomerase 2 family)
VVRAVFLGCYTDGAGGLGSGIVVARHDPATGALRDPVLAAATPSPSFVAGRGDVLYAVNELDEGTLTAFRVHDDLSLTELGRWPTGGAFPCHVAVDPGGATVVVSNYGSGSVATYPIGPDGVPVGRGDLVVHHGQGKHPDRQEGPHAHSAIPTPRGLLAVDLGVDTIYQYQMDPGTGSLGDGAPLLRLPPGTGPRHIVHTGQTLYVVGELTATLHTFTLAESEGHWHEAGTVSTSVVEGAAPSEVDLRGRWLYVANRGPDTIAVFDAAGGRPVRVGEVSTGGAWPRHFAIVDRFLYVANERSHTVVAFALDPATGMPVPTGDVLPTPSPTCVLPWPA